MRGVHAPTSGVLLLEMSNRSLWDGRWVALKMKKLDRSAIVVELMVNLASSPPCLIRQS